MRDRIKRWLLILMVGILIFHQISPRLLSASSVGVEATTAADLKEEVALSGEQQEEEDTGQEKRDEKNDEEEETTEMDSEVDTGQEEETTEMDSEIDTGQGESTEVKTISTEQRESDGLEKTADHEKEAGTKNNSMKIRAAVPLSDDNINMPASTYKTMILQGAKGKGQRIAASGKVKMLSDNKEIQKDIDTNHKEYSSFTPHWSAGTTAVLSTQTGSKDISTYLKNPDKAAHAGVFGKPVNEPYIVGGRVYRLTASMKNQLSCTYSNVGRYYDRSSGRSYAIDMKAVLVDFTAKNKETTNVQKAVEAGVLGEQGGALFAFVGKIGIGVLDAFCDSVTIKYSYYIHGTQTPINVKGFAQFSDVDAQQGIEFSSQADYFYAINGANQYLGCSKGVYSAGNKAYIYSLSSQEYSNSKEHCFFALFSGSELTLRYTFAKCSREDDGGANNGNALKQYNVPYDSSTVRTYSGSESGGYMSFTAKQAFLSQPEIGKTVFNGDDIEAEVSTPHKDTSNVLSDISSSFTYKVRTICPYEDASEHHYSTWQVKDQISPFLNVKKIVIYDGTGKKNDDFNIKTEEQKDGATLVTASAKNVSDQNFYEKNWYDMYITVQVKSLEELEKYHLDFSDVYEKNGTKQGMYVLKNSASLLTGTTLNSNETETVVPQCVKVKKMDEQGKPIQGITFGIFLDQKADVQKDKPMATAMTNQEGIAHFKRTTFFTLAGKDGPYYIKEVSRGEFENVYRMDSEWFYEFSSAQGNGVVYGDIGENSKNILKNSSKRLNENTVVIRKKNKETELCLKDAIFSLYQWSDVADSYMKVDQLKQEKDENGYYYTNKKVIMATEDNRGRFMVQETKAPFGCYNSGQRWTFETTDTYDEDNKKLEFFYETNSGVTVSQDGVLYYENELQKGRILIEKTDEEENAVKGAVFGIWADSDIYAPWQYDENGVLLEGEEPLVAKDTLCDKITTNQEGKSFSKLLYMGKYRVMEIEGATDHVKSDQVYVVTLEYPDEDTTRVVTTTLEVGNNLMKPSMAIAKLAERTRNEQGNEVAFQKDTGRYTEKKVPGIYKSNERIRYKITVTNTGNTDLYHLRLTEDMTLPNDEKQKLEDYVDKGSASFVIPSDQKYDSVLGNAVSCSLVGDDGQCMILDKLAVGDSVCVYFEVEILDQSANVYQLRNKVSVTASYDNNQETPNQRLIPVNTENLVDEEGNLLTEDEDKIHIPGEADHTVVKKADRTTGCIISNGLLNGTKVPGIYQAGENVKFTIAIRNNGTANLKKIIVSDLLSEELKNAIEENSASFQLDVTDGYMLTESGEKIEARIQDATHVILCENGDSITGKGVLKPGDVATLKFSVILKQEVAGLYDLENKVMVNSFYYTGEKDCELPPVEDIDYIEVPGEPEAKLAKIADHTTGTVLVEGRYEQEKITGSYKNEEQVIYTITVTNSGTADLYDLIVKDEMEERLLSAMVKDSVGFRYGKYRTKQGDIITGTKEESAEGYYRIRLSCLHAGDSVELLLYGKINAKAGELSKLENKASVTAHYKKGNEEQQKKYKELVEQSSVTYVLQYYANNGTTEKTSDSETPIQMKKEIKINGNPFSKEGYVFLGWNTKEDGTGESYAPGAYFSMPAQDVKLYAQWGKTGSVLPKQYEYSLIYHSNNAKKQEQPDSETKCLAGTIISLDNNMFSHEGYRFLGWSLSPETTDALLQEGNSYQMPKRDVHLYAQWEKIEKVSLTYHSNFTNSLPGDSEIEETKTDFQTPCSAGTKIRIKQCEFEREGYIFEGWSQDAKAEKAEIKPEQIFMLEKDTDIYAIWKPEREGKRRVIYRLYYHGNNETTDCYVDSESPCEAEKTILLDECLFSYPRYEFNGWNTKPDGTGKQWNPGDTISMAGKEIHMYAQWKQQRMCNLTYDSNYPVESGKTKQMQKTDAECPCKEETEMVLDGNTFQCDGYAFLGWSLHPDNHNETSGLLLPGEKYLLMEDTVLYAIWTNQIKEYSFMYSSNTDSSKWETDIYSPVPAGTPHKLIKNPFRDSSRSFVGWSFNADTDPDSKDILYPGTIVEQPARNTVLYAIWKQEETFSLSYDANDGTSGTKVVDEETPCVKEENILINYPSFTRKGYRFVGWSLKSTAQIEDVNDIIYPGCEYTMPEKNVILYALWEKTAEDNNIDTESGTSQYTPITVTNLMQDEDYINIPGKADLRIAKAADRTRGITLENGRYQGSRKEGTYYKGETITYKITVSNVGTAAAYDVKINEIPSDTCKKALKIEGFSASAGETIKTSLGKTICVLKKNDDQVILDRLDSGDRVILYYEAIVKEDQVQNKSLKNTVEVTGKQEGGIDIPKTKLMSDSDHIKIAKKISGNKNIKFHSPKTGDRNPVIPLIILSVGMFLTAVIIFTIKKKRKQCHL